MWVEACARIRPSVAVILGERYLNVEGETRRVFFALGSAFRVSTNNPPLFLTCQHVAVEEVESLVIGRLPVADDVPLTKALAGARVEASDAELDLALVLAGKEAYSVPPVAWNSELLPIGSPVAAYGFPLQEGPQLVKGGGTLTVSARVSAGFVSSCDSAMALQPEEERSLHYELNLAAYPGISGAPCFDLEGRVVGVVRVSALHGGTTALYGYARRAAEVISFLEEHRVPYEAVGAC